MSEAGENLGSGLVCVALLAMGILSATRAAACPPACHTATLSTWEVRQVPYVARVRRYDHCGRPYTAIVVCHRAVKVLAGRTVTICE